MRSKKPVGIAFLAIGITFMALGMSRQRAFVGVGMAFLVLGLSFWHVARLPVGRAEARFR